MKQLSKNWILEGLQDFEYKKYLILAYSNFIRKEFQSLKLFPYYLDLKEQKRYIDEIVKISKDVKIGKEIIPSQNETIKYIYDTTLFAEREFNVLIDESEEVLHNLNLKIRVAPIGLVTNSRFSGYLIFKNGSTKDVLIFNYLLDYFDIITKQFDNIKLRFISVLNKGLFETYESLKLKILKDFYKRFDMGLNMFLISTEKKIPLFESLMPIGTKKLKDYLICD